MLELDDLRVQYGDAVALDGIDLTVADHETVCVLGPSGCGKSTLLRAIAGLEQPANGRVDVGRPTTSPAIAPHRRQFGLMFQDHALFPHRDVLGNVAFGVAHAGRLPDRCRGAGTGRARTRRALRLRAPARPRALRR